MSPTAKSSAGFAFDGASADPAVQVRMVTRERQVRQRVHLFAAEGDAGSDWFYADSVVCLVVAVIIVVADANDDHHAVGPSRSGFALDCDFARLAARPRCLPLGALQAPACTQQDPLSTPDLAGADVGGGGHVRTASTSGETRASLRDSSR